MYFNALPNTKSYPKTYFVIENGKCIHAESESEAELIHFFGYGNVFKTQTDCLNEIRERENKKQRKLSETETKKLIKEQIAYGRSLMSELDWEIRKESLKSIEAKQKEFALQMMNNGN